MMGQILCQQCSGLGAIQREAFTLDGIRYPVKEVDCEECDGTGHICDECFESPDHCYCDETNLFHAS